MLDAVRARHDQGHRHTRCAASPLAHERIEMHGLAGAVDTTIGIEECIEGAGLLAAFDAAVGEVECSGGQIEESVLTVGGLCDQQRRLRTALAAYEAGLEA